MNCLLTSHLACCTLLVLIVFQIDTSHATPRTPTYKDSYSSNRSKAKSTSHSINPDREKYFSKICSRSLKVPRKYVPKCVRSLSKQEQKQNRKLSTKIKTYKESNNLYNEKLTKCQQNLGLTDNNFKRLNKKVKYLEQIAQHKDDQMSDIQIKLNQKDLEADNCRQNARKMKDEFGKTKTGYVDTYNKAKTCGRGLKHTQSVLGQCRKQNVFLQDEVQKMGDLMNGIKVVDQSGKRRA